MSRSTSFICPISSLPRPLMVPSPSAVMVHPPFAATPFACDPYASFVSDAVWGRQPPRRRAIRRYRLMVNTVFEAIDLESEGSRLILLHIDRTRTLATGSRGEAPGRCRARNRWLCGLRQIAPLDQTL